MAESFKLCIVINLFTTVGHSHVTQSPGEIAAISVAIILGVIIISALILGIKKYMTTARRRRPCTNCGTFITETETCPVCGKLPEGEKK